MTAPKFKPVDAPVKHVPAYPFEISILKADGTPGGSRGQIVKLTDLGFLMKVDGTQAYKVGEDHQVSFELPVVGGKVKAAVKVVKTYDAMEVVGKEQVKKRTIEMHFKNLSVADKGNINSYLVKSGQKK